MKKPGGNYCAAVNCNNNYGSSSGLSMFRFPKDPERCKRWLINTRRKDIMRLDSITLYTSYRICANHFEDGMFMDPKKTKLMPKAIPTIFSIPNPPKRVACKRKLPNYHIEKADDVQIKQAQRVRKTTSTSVSHPKVVSESSTTNAEINTVNCKISVKSADEETKGDAACSHVKPYRISGTARKTSSPSFCHPKVANESRTISATAEMSHKASGPSTDVQIQGHGASFSRLNPHPRDAMKAVPSRAHMKLVSTSSTTLKANAEISEAIAGEHDTSETQNGGASSDGKQCQSAENEFPNITDNMNLESSEKTKQKVESQIVRVTVAAKKLSALRCCCADNNVSPELSIEMKKCQATDSIDGESVGCTGAPVIHDSLVRSSSKTPFIIMCDMHLWKLKSHFSCPLCGVFCAQGTFMRCPGFDNSNKVSHLFHRQCILSFCRNGLCCPHCGNKSNIKPIKLDLRSTSTPVVLRQAMSPSAKRISSGMSFPQTPKQIKSVAIKLKSGSVLNTSGLISEVDQQTLDTLLKEVVLVHKNGNIPSYPLKELYSAVVEEETTKVLYMVIKGAPCGTMFKTHNTRETALHAAARAGNVIIAHVLIQAGGMIDYNDDCLRTPLMMGIEYDKIDVVQYLVSRGADVNHVNNSGSSCLHKATETENFRMCRVLLGDGKVKLDLRDTDGLTPLALASKLGYFDIVELLLERGRADPKVTDEEENTALHWAAFSGNTEICKACINFGCNINEVNFHGDTALHIATRRNNSDAIDYLLAMGADCDVKNKAGEYPLDYCNNDSASRESFELNAMIRTLRKQTVAAERIVLPDISYGAEKRPIQCINWFDKTDLIAEDFTYITENVEISSGKMTRSITSLQHCTCSGDCSSSDCKCGNFSSRCWYDEKGRLVPEFNYVNPPVLIECNNACFCDVSICKNRVVQKGIKCYLQLFRTADRGWGVRTLKFIPKGSFVCEYLGEILCNSDADEKEDDTYLFDFDNREGETYCLDARQFGNVSRFINHLCDANLITVKVLGDVQDTFPKIAFFSSRDIAQFEELGFDYGIKFWTIKSKFFTCTCQSKYCKYS